MFDFGVMFSMSIVAVLNMMSSLCHPQWPSEGLPSHVRIPIWQYFLIFKGAWRHSQITWRHPPPRWQKSGKIKKSHLKGPKPSNHISEAIVVVVRFWSATTAIGVSWDWFVFSAAIAIFVVAAVTLLLQWFGICQIVVDCCFRCCCWLALLLALFVLAVTVVTILFLTLIVVIVVFDSIVL